MKMVQVNIITDNEVPPVLGIVQAWEGNGREYEIPDQLLQALYSGLDTVRAIEMAIMEYVAKAHPDAEDVVRWIAEQAED